MTPKFLIAIADEYGFNENSRFEVSIATSGVAPVPTLKTQPTLKFSFLPFVCKVKRLNQQIHTTNLEQQKCFSKLNCR